MQGFESTPFNSLQSKTSNSDEPGLYSLLKPLFQERLRKKRILLNDDQRHCLAVKGRVLGRKTLEEVGTLSTPDTILRWHLMLVVDKWDYSDRRKNTLGRPYRQTNSAELQSPFGTGVVGLVNELQQRII